MKWFVAHTTTSLLALFTLSVNNSDHNRIANKMLVFTGYRSEDQTKKMTSNFAIIRFFSPLPFPFVPLSCSPHLLSLSLSCFDPYPLKGNSTYRLMNLCDSATYTRWWPIKICMLSTVHNNNRLYIFILLSTNTNCVFSYYPFCFVLLTF